MRDSCLNECSENPTCLAHIYIRAADLPISSGTGIRLGVYLLMVVLLDKIGAGFFNLDSLTAIQ